MITRLVIENLGPITRVEVPIGRFTVLVGPNDSGKSTILRALEILDALARPAPDAGRRSIPLTLPHDARDHEPARVITFAATGTTEGSTFEYRVSFEGLGGRVRVHAEQLFWRGALVAIAPDGNVAVGPNGEAKRVDTYWRTEGALIGADLVAPEYGMFAAVARELRWMSVRFDPKRIAEPCPNEVRDDVIERDGYGVAAVIDRLKTSTDSTAIANIAERLKTFSPFARGLGTKKTTIGSGKVGKGVILSLDGGAEIELAQASDGLRLALAFLTLRHTHEHRFLVEEPENGIHPRVAREIVDVLRETSRLPDGQVLATTHSPLLLNHVEPEEAVVITRDSKGVRATPMLETSWFRDRAKDFALGELWYNVGEKELVPEGS